VFCCCGLAPCAVAPSLPHTHHPSTPHDQVCGITFNPHYAQEAAAARTAQGGGGSSGSSSSGSESGSEGGSVSSGSDSSIDSDDEGVEAHDRHHLHLSRSSSSKSAAAGGGGRKGGAAAGAEGDGDRPLQFATWGARHVKLWTRTWDEVGGVGLVWVRCVYGGGLRLLRECCKGHVTAGKRRESSNTAAASTKQATTLLNLNRNQPTTQPPPPGWS